MIAMAMGVSLALLAVGYVVYPLLRAGPGRCGKCGTKMEAEASFCSECGTALELPAEEKDLGERS